MSALRIALLATVAIVLAAPSAAAVANDVFERSWGGIEFSGSDRDEQADGSTLAIAVDTDTGGLVSAGTAGSAEWAYRHGPDGRQTQRFRLEKSVTALAVMPGGDLVEGTSSGKLVRYARDTGKAGQTLAADGPVVALAAGPESSLFVATASSIARYTSGGIKSATFPVAGVKSLAVGATGALHVADGKQARVLAADGSTVRTLSGLTAPDGIGVDSTGRVFVHDTTGGGFDVKVFAADGTPLGSTTAGFYDIQSEARERPGDPVLLAVSGPGDVYFVAQNPDILRIPAAVVPSPRFRVDDPSRAVPQFDDTDPIAVSVGKQATFTTNVFRSLSTDVSLSLSGPAAFELAPGVPATTQVAIAAGKDFAPVTWRFSVTKPGRAPVMLVARGKGPTGQVTRLAKKLPVYGIDGPNITIQGAATRRGANYSLVAIQVDIGATKVKKSDRADLVQYLSDTFQVESSARIAGKPVEDLGFEIGESLTGMCVPFPTKGTPRIAVTAKLAATGRFAGATARRTVRPTSRPRTALMKDCYESIDLAGLR